MYTLQMLLAVAFSLTMMFGWITHIAESYAAEAWVLLLVGAFIFPVGAIHGIGTWFGVW